MPAVRRRPRAAAARALKALATRLDVRLLQLLVDLEQLEGKRAALNARVEEGWFSLSKSRYTMGVKAVSSLQYSSSMAPLFRVCTSEPEAGRPEFQVVFTRPRDPKDSRPKEAESVIDHGELESKALVPPMLRRRPQSQGSPLEPSPATAARVASPERDPLTWFGILVPQSLRQAQESFRAAVLMAGEIAGLQSRIQWGRAQMEALRKEKQKLLKQLKMA